MFVSKLQVAHSGGKDWELTAPLVYKGKFEWFVIREGFETDFASIPRIFRWLLDNAGRNSEAAVLHDVLWRLSKAGDSRVDAWNVDALFRRALRQTGSTALARGIMWVAVRAAAIAGGRFGSPTHIGLFTRITSLVGMALVAVALLFFPTIAVLGGILVYWIASWVVAVIWLAAYESSHFGTAERNLPWPMNDRRPVKKGTPGDVLRVVKSGSPEAEKLEAIEEQGPRIVNPDELAHLWQSE